MEKSASSFLLQRRAPTLIMKIWTQNLLCPAFSTTDNDDDDDKAACISAYYRPIQLFKSNQNIINVFDKPSYDLDVGLNELVTWHICYLESSKKTFAQ